MQNQAKTNNNIFPFFVGVIAFTVFYVILGGWDTAEAAHTLRFEYALFVGIIAGLAAKLG